MLRWRLVVSAILIPLAVFLFWLDHCTRETSWPLMILCQLLSLRAVWELNELLRVRGLNPTRWLTMLLTCLVVASGWVHVATEGAAASEGPGWTAAGPIVGAWSLSFLILFLASAIRFQEPGRTMENLSVEWFIVTYIGAMLAITAQLRWVAGAHAGYLVLGSVLVATKGGDIGGYTIGRLFGRRKMTPKLSPGKTWAGAFGAVAFASVGTWAWLHWGTAYWDAGWIAPANGWCFVYGAILGVVGLVGDLCESLVKRDVGQKDAPALLPGFGGLMDLIDSVIYTGPVAWVLWNLMPLATWK